MPFTDSFRLDPKFSELRLEDMIGPGSLVSDVFSVDGRDGEYEHVFDWDSFSPAVWQDGIYSVHGLEGFEPDSMALVTGGRTVGFYIDGMAWIDPEHRGKGLGAAMVASFVAWTGRLPSVHDIGFTQAGLRTHAAAAKLVCESFAERSRRP